MKKIMIRKFSTAQRITADKRLRYATPKLPLATSFIRKTLWASLTIKNEHYGKQNVSFRNATIFYYKNRRN
jgi:hypothetical protein